MQKKIFLVVLMIFLAEGNIFPSAEQIGTTSNNFVKILIPAKPAGMGETYVALCNDIDSIQYNPAGLAKSLSSEISLTHIEWFQQVEYENMDYSMIFPFGTIAVSLNWLHMTPITKTIQSGTTWQSLYTFSPYSIYGIATYAKQFTDNLSIGANLKILNYTIDSQDTSGSSFSFLFDAGLIYDMPFLNGLSAGLAFTDIGPQTTFISESFSQPINMKLGLGYSVNNFNIEGDVQLAEDNDLNYSFGASYTAFNILALRLGYKLGTIQQPTFGAGIILDALHLDYAFVPYNEDLGLTNRITLTYDFGMPPFNITAEPAVFAPRGDKRFKKNFSFITPDLEMNKVKEIAINVSDPAGLPIKNIVFKNPSQKLYWNGYNNLSKLVPDGTYTLKAHVIYKNGAKSDSNEVALEVDDTPPQVSIDADPKILKPNEIGIIVVPVSFKPFATDLHNIGAWDLFIKDDKGMVVKKFSGNGNPPSPIIWDGTNDKGTNIDPGKVYSYTFYASDTVGNWAHTAPQFVHVLLREIVINLAADTLFDIGKADVKISVYQDLQKIADMIKSHKNATVIVEGHTDNMPIKRSIYPDNLALSQARAEAVVKFFIDLFGMPPNIFTAVGKGDTMPVASNDTDEGRQKNRRVTIRIKASEWE